MSTHPSMADSLLHALGHADRFRVRRMFGEYALYADNKVVGLVCNDMLYVKILPASSALATECEQDAPYPGARPHYVISEDMWLSMPDLADLLLSVAKVIPEKKKVNKKRI